VDPQTLAMLGDRLHENGVLTGEDLAVFDDDTFGAGTLGLVWDEVSLERAVAHVETTQRHFQPFGLVHGGVWCSIVESMASIGAALHVMGDGRIVVGVSNSTDFLRSHRTGRVDAVAEPLHVGRSQQLWQVVITRSSDAKVIARGQVRLQNLDPTVVGS
jgi:1,4-dihydroxy-2-naphthoyl-CoA hydrolase